MLDGEEFGDDNFDFDEDADNDDDLMPRDDIDATYKSVVCGHGVHERRGEGPGTKCWPLRVRLSFAPLKPCET